MKQIFFIIFIFTQVLFLGACHNSLIHNRADEYNTAGSVPPMEIPLELSATDMTSYYPVASDNQNNEVAPVDLLPPNLSRTTKK